MHNLSMEYVEYFLTQMKLEGLTPGLDGFFKIHDQQQNEQPLVLLARLASGQEVTYINLDLPGEIREKLQERSLDFASKQWMAQFFEKFGIATRIGHFKTFVFPQTFLHASNTGVRALASTDPAVQEFGFGGLSDPVYVILEQGKIAAACVSVREDQACAEAWVYTAPDHRGKGLARRVTTAWGRAVLESGRVAFYSYKAENLASAGLANRLDLTDVFEELGVERV